MVMPQTPKRRVSQAGTIVHTLLASVELFHNGGQPWASISVNGHNEIISLRTRAFREWISNSYYKQFQKVPRNPAIESALGVLAGEAINHSPEYQLFIRRAEYQGKIYIDLCNDRWEVLEITPKGWKVITDPPIKFMRKRGSLPLPVPQPGGSMDELEQFLNFDKEEDFTLVVSWLLAAFSEGPYPVLNIGGEAGQGKSTTSRLLRSLIDPNAAPIRTRPKDERDLMIAAGNSWVLAFDNISSIQDWLSDAFCRLSTGGGWATRELWTNEDETIINAKRPIVVNGISEIISRGDLLDRSILVNLPLLPEWRRQPEDELWINFEAARPRILGAICDILAGTLANLPRVQLTNRPRMLDFAKFITAAEPVLCWQHGRFMQAYIENRTTANDAMLEDSFLAGEIQDLVKSQDWSGSKQDLLSELLLRTLGTPGYDKLLKYKPQQLKSELRRLAPNMRANGIDIQFLGPTHKNGKSVRLITINNLMLKAKVTVP